MKLFAPTLAVDAAMPVASADTLGQLAFFGNRVFICIAVGALFTWLPLTNEIDGKVFEEAAASDTWTLAHSLDTLAPVVQIFDAAGEMVIPDSIVVTDANTVTVTFGAAMAGKAIVVSVGSA
jgi:hypothetical protein